MIRGLALVVLTLALAACAGSRSAAPSLSPAQARSALPPEWRWVDTHGIEVAVPARWRLGRGMCGTPKANTVLWNEDGIGPRPNAAQPFVPKGAVRVILCSYKGPWLDQSNRIGRRNAAGLARAFASAPFGFSHAKRGSILPSSCRPTWNDSLVIGDFEYAGDRPPVSVSAHLDGCSRLGASNGRWGIRLRPGWVNRLIDDAYYAGDYLPYAE